MKNCYFDPTTRVIADLIPLELTYPTVIPVNGYVITRINVPIQHRGRGLGSHILSRILEDADQTDATLYLDILPSGPLDYYALENWYTRYGFRRRMDSFLNDLGYNYKRLPGTLAFPVTPPIIHIPKDVYI